MFSVSPCLKTKGFGQFGLSVEVGGGGGVEEQLLLYASF